MLKTIFNNMKKNREGSVLVFVIMIFLVITILSTSIFSIFSSNLKMSFTQGEAMRGHYLALAGIDVTKATLLSTLTVASGVEKSVFNHIREKKIALLRDAINIDGEVVNITVQYDESEDVVTIYSSAILSSGTTTDLSLKLEFSGNQYKERWVK